MPFIRGLILYPLGDRELGILLLVLIGIWRPGTFGMPPLGTQGGEDRQTDIGGNPSEVVSSLSVEARGLIRKVRVSSC